MKNLNQVDDDWWWSWYKFVGVDQADLLQAQHIRVLHTNGRTNIIFCSQKEASSKTECSIIGIICLHAQTPFKSKVTIACLHKLITQIILQKTLMFQTCAWAVVCTTVFVPEPRIDAVLHVHLGKYKLNSMPTGLCLVINNINFNAASLDPRRGSEKDYSNIERVFR